MYTKTEEKIIEIGRTESIEAYKNDEILKRFSTYVFSFNQQLDWSCQDLKFFFKGLVLCEKFFKWQGGSVAANIFALQRLEPMLTAQENIDLLNWAFENRGWNKYTPTGSNYPLCKSYNEMLEADAWKAKRIKQHDSNTVEQQESKKQKEIIKQKRHSEGQKKSKARSEELKEEMRSFCLKDIKKKTEMIKNGELTFPINMLPDEEIDLFYHHVVFSKDERKRFLSTLPRNRSTSQRIRQLKDDIRTEKKEKANLAYKHKVRTKRVGYITSFFGIIISSIPVLIVLYLIFYLPIKCGDESAQKTADKMKAQAIERDIREFEDAQKILRNESEHESNKTTTHGEKLKSAAEQGDVKAQYLLGIMYYLGKSVDEEAVRDYQEALKWFRLAAENRNADAMYALSLMYFNGQGVKNNKYIAYMWSDIAARNGNENAKEMRDSYIEMYSMKSEQILKAQELVDECIEKNYKDCG